MSNIMQFGDRGRGSRIALDAENDMHAIERLVRVLWLTGRGLLPDGDAGDVAAIQQIADEIDKEGA
jgi:hypothetical protein